jgi:hypothetical protein
MPSEVRALQDFRDTLNTVTEAGVRNPSGTAYVIGDALKRLGNHSTIFSKWFGDQAAAISDARAATSGRLSRSAPRPTDMPIGAFREMAPGLGGVAGERGDVKPGLGGAVIGIRHPSMIPGLLGL